MDKYLTATFKITFQYDLYNIRLGIEQYQVLLEWVKEQKELIYKTVSKMNVSHSRL